ncbi:hypothetical protein Y1Q_0009833 [Alligator mississippiensis]|uniref:Uncharacterized protein n=1 Tax=Alligator mississippiensis TaxID=8496 RepID=A0A151MWY7_ALLMI|nr:hypothetical protein Y1Q_0009833 [Alligator mississippiensis]
MILGHLFTPNPQSDAGQFTVPGTEHLISEKLQTLTNSFFLMTLQALQLHVGDRLQLAAGALWMCQLCRRRTQDHTLLLDRVVMALEDRLVDAWMWWVEDVASQDRWWVEDMAHEEAWDWCKEVQDWAHWEFRAQLLALECKCMEALWE